MVTDTARRGTTVVLAVSLLSVPVAGIAIQSLSFTPITAGTGPVPQSEDIALDDQDLLYTGTNVDGVSVTVNNTAAGAHDVDVHTRLLDASDTILVEKTKATSISGNTVKDVTVDYASSNEPNVNDVDSVEVLLEVTA